MKSKVLSLFFLLLTCNSCMRVDTDGIQNLNGDQITILGHGGMGLISPENPFPLSSPGSLLKAVEGYNVDGVDADIQMSSDSVLMLFHDGRLELQTNCTGCIAEKTAEELEACNYRSSFSTQLFMEERIGRLEDFVARMAARPVRPLLMLDVKTNLNCGQAPERRRFLGQLVRQLDTLIQRYDGEDWMLVDSRDRDFLRLLRQKNDQIKIIFAGAWSEDLPQVALDERFSGLCLQFETVSAEDIRTLHQLGLQVMLWDVKTRSAAISAINKHPDFIVTDRIVLMQQLLQR